MLSEKEEATAKKKFNAAADAPLVEPTVDEQVIRGVARNAPVVTYQMNIVLYGS